MYRIAIIIPVHNRLPYTQECLGILEQQVNTMFYRKNEIFTIVVDDGSSDGTGDWIRKNHPGVLVLRGSGDLWYSGSLNLGIKHALMELNCDFVMIWENDVIPVAGYFENLQSILEQWDGKSIISSKLNYKVKPEFVFSMGGTFNQKTGNKGLIGRNQPDGPLYEKPIEADWFSGQQALIHKDIILKVGYFDDKNFPQYHADIDYSLRARKAGFKNIIYPTLKLLNDSETTGINHLKNKTIGQFIESLYSIRSNANIVKEIKFYRKHTTGILAYKSLIKRYLLYTGSFAKWKVLGWFGIKRDNKDLL